MDDVTVAELDPVTVDGTELHYVDQGGADKKQTTDQTKEYILNGTLPAVTVVSGAEEHIVRQGGVPKKQTTDQSKEYILNGILPAVTVVSGAEEHIVRQGGVPKKQTTDQTKAHVLSGGQTTTVTVITNLNKAGYVLQKKERTLTLTNGIITDIGTESVWIDVGDFSSPY